MRRYGITGGIGAGKSSVTEILRVLGYTVMDLDQIARDVVEPESRGLGAIIDTFGAAYLNLEGTLNRRMLADLVFKDAAQLAKLDALIGPFLWDEVERRSAEMAEEIVFLDGALIIEKQMYEKLDGTILVTAPVTVRVRRAMERDGVLPEQIEARIAAQMPDAEKAQIADFVLDNSGTLNELRDRTLAIVKALKQ